MANATSFCGSFLHFLLLLAAVAVAVSVASELRRPDLSQAYNHTVLLDDDQVAFFWTLHPDSISIAARSKKTSTSGYLAIAIGDGMVNSHAYVGWTDADGNGRVSTYWIDGKDVSRLHPTSEKQLADARFQSEKGLLSLEFRRPLSSPCVGWPECENHIDPDLPLPIVWARGARWSDTRLSWGNMHAITSDRAVRVLLTHGTVEEVKGVPLAYAAHGFFMFISWGILLPCGVLAARYLRRQWHLRLQSSGLALALIAIVPAAFELRGLVLSSTHSAIGIAAMSMACAQPINAYLRPKPPAAGGEVASGATILWPSIHFWIGRSAILVGIVAILSGLKQVADAYDCEAVDAATWAFMLWVLVGAAVALFLEYMELKRSRKERNSFAGRFGSQGNGEEEECSIDLLKSQEPPGRSQGISAAAPSGGSRKVSILQARASVVDSSESSSGFSKRMERAWIISKLWVTEGNEVARKIVVATSDCSWKRLLLSYGFQPRPIACSTCESDGYVECKWCAGTGFFILGNQMLCEVPSRNTTCIICAGKGSTACPDCKGTGFRAKWLEDPQPPK
ncbi:hypothetical protein ZIOFF_040599 [Zingiber officinale]|uniref:Uncharacterized protein n=1 Tax=Zingiber officinale TaxID=94328 RepID=A0A8J5GCV2_ZINOF|nr:hypothetical protein ZIOFF_040599 [Zingiber officinale]